jgi:hypothetical protein
MRSLMNLIGESFVARRLRPHLHLRAVLLGWDPLVGGEAMAVVVEETLGSAIIMAE